MIDSVPMLSGRRRLTVMAAALAAMVLLLLLLGVVGAQASRGNPLELSEKTASDSTASPGGTLGYTIVVENSGGINLPTVVMTDDIPTEITYVPNSVDVTGGGVVSYTNGVLTWNGGVNAGGQIVVTFDAIINGGVIDGTVITNTAVISGGGFLTMASAYVNVVTETVKYFPAVYRTPPSVVLAAIPIPDSNNSWTLNWTPNTTAGITGYEIEEAQDTAFTQGVVVYSSANTTLQVTKPRNGPNLYYYRVHALGSWGSGPWSNVQRRVGIYQDDFTGTTTDWTMVREDTDDVDNAVYVSGGNLVLEMNSRWDYVIASPLVSAVQAPEAPYRIEARMSFDGVDNLHTYGIIFGGDWNGQTCPNANFTSCFNHYYRESMIWYGATNRLRTQVKRVDYHDANNNAGRGPQLWGPSDLNVNPPPATWQVWRIDVSANGQIDLFVNGNFYATINDSTYIDDPYFGLFAATDEYTGLDVWVDWFRVTPLQ